MVSDCSDTFTDIESMIKTSKIEIFKRTNVLNGYGISQKWNLKKRLASFKATISLMLEALSGYNLNCAVVNTDL